MRKWGGSKNKQRGCTGDTVNKVSTVSIRKHVLRCKICVLQNYGVGYSIHLKYRDTQEAFTQQQGSLEHHRQIITSNPELRRRVDATQTRKLSLSAVTHYEHTHSHPIGSSMDAHTVHPSHKNDFNA